MDQQHLISSMPTEPRPPIAVKKITARIEDALRCPTPPEQPPALATTSDTCEPPPPMAPPAPPATSPTPPPHASGIVTALAELPEKALLSESALANALGVSKRTVRRMVSRFEIPPPVRFGGKSTWQAGAILRWFEARADRLAREAERAAAKIQRLSA